MTEYVLMPGADYQNICNALREKTGSTEPIRSGEIAGQIADLSGDNHYDVFWDNYQNNDGNYKRAFSNRCWTDKTYNPKNPLVCTLSAEYAFQNANITDTKVPIQVYDCSAAFLFADCYELKTVPYVGLFGVTSTSTFALGCINLENITFDGEIPTGIGFASSSKLTDASVQSIIDHLADLTGKTTQKLTFHNAVGSKLTEVQKATITAKNWTLVY